LQFLALQSNHIKEIKGVRHLDNLAFLSLSYNRIKEYDPQQLPKNILILKLVGNPCETQMKEYRKAAILNCQLLEEMDNVTVHVAERMHYQGLVEIDLEKQLSEIKDKRIEKELQSRVEDEVMEVSHEGIIL